MERDYAELIKYYKTMIEYGRKLADAGKELEAEGGTAASMLADSVSSRNIGKVRECSEKLTVIGNHIIAEAENKLERFIKDKEDFDNL